MNTDRNNETIQSVNKAIEETLFKPDAMGYTRFAKETHDAVFEEGVHGEPSRFQRELKKGFYNTFGRWFFAGGALVLLALAGGYYQLQDHEEQLTEGGRYTEEDALEDRRIQEGRDQRQDEDMARLEDVINRGFSDIRELIINNK